MGMKYSDYVDYEKLDPVKKLLLEKVALPTSWGRNLNRFGITYRPESLGESAAVYDFVKRDFMIAFIIESLGTKILDADRIRGKVEVSKRFKLLRKPIYPGIGRDMIAMVVYDLNNVSAMAVGLGDFLACGSSDYFEDKERVEDIIEGFRIGADEAGASLACGDTPELQELVNSESLVIAAAGFGIIRPKSRFTAGGRKIKEGMGIYGLRSGGIHSNGITLARRIIEKTEEGYATRLPDSGQMIGEAILKPTKIYSKYYEDLFDEGIDIPYISAITGHAFQGKVARAKRDFTYVIESLPLPQEEFSFLMQKGPVTLKEAYRTWNMGVGAVIIASRDYEKSIFQISRENGIECFYLGYIKKGPRRVIMPFKENGKQVIYTP